MQPPAPSLPREEGARGCADAPPPHGRGPRWPCCPAGRPRQQSPGVRATPTQTDTDRHGPPGPTGSSEIEGGFTALRGAWRVPGRAGGLWGLGLQDVGHQLPLGQGLDLGETLNPTLSARGVGHGVLSPVSGSGSQNFRRESRAGPAGPPQGHSRTRGWGGAGTSPPTPPPPTHLSKTLRRLSLPSFLQLGLLPGASPGGPASGLGRASEEDPSCATPPHPRRHAGLGASWDEGPAWGLSQARCPHLDHPAWSGWARVPGCRGPPRPHPDIPGHFSLGHMAMNPSGGSQGVFSPTQPRSPGAGGPPTPSGGLSPPAEPARASPLPSPWPAPPVPPAAGQTAGHLAGGPSAVLIPGSTHRKATPGTDEVWSYSHQQGDRSRLAVRECPLLPPQPPLAVWLLFVAQPSKQQTLSSLDPGTESRLESWRGGAPADSRGGLARLGGPCAKPLQSAHPLERGLTPDRAAGRQARPGCGGDQGEIVPVCLSP